MGSMRAFAATLTSAIIFLCAAGTARAQRLPTTVTPSHYDLNITVDLQRARFEGSETIRVDLAQPTRTIVLNAAEIAFRDVTIGVGASSQKATVSLSEPLQTATLTVAKPLPKGATEIHLSYVGILNDKLRGFYLSTEKDGATPSRSSRRPTRGAPFRASTSRRSRPRSTSR